MKGKRGPERMYHVRVPMTLNMEFALKEEMEEESMEEGLTVTEFIARAVQERIDRKKESGHEKPITCLNVTSLIKRDEGHELTVNEVLETIDNAKTHEEMGVGLTVTADIASSMKRRSRLLYFKGIRPKEVDRKLVFNGRRI